MIVLDTNILISALIKDSTTRKIIIQSGLTFAYPEISLREIFSYKDYILGKTGYNSKQFDAILNKLLDYINLIPINIIKPMIPEAFKIMKNIDVKDTIFLATCMALKNSDIWTNDKDFERQHIVKVVSTKNMIKLFSKKG